MLVVSILGYHMASPWSSAQLPLRLCRWCLEFLPLDPNSVNMIASSILTLLIATKVGGLVVPGMLLSDQNRSYIAAHCVSTWHMVVYQRRSGGDGRGKAVTNHPSSLGTSAAEENVSDGKSLGWPQSELTYEEPHACAQARRGEAVKRSDMRLEFGVEAPEGLRSHCGGC